MRQRTINFVDEETGIVVNDYIYKTTDGGISLQQQAYGYYGSISMLNYNIGYFYRLQTGEFISTKKLLLMK
jgi:hypothetical protein